MTTLAPLDRTARSARPCCAAPPRRLRRPLLPRARRVGRGHGRRTGDRRRGRPPLPPGHRAGPAASALWLGGLIPLLVAGWRGRPPAPAGTAARRGRHRGPSSRVLAPGNGGASPPRRGHRSARWAGPAGAPRSSPAGSTPSSPRSPCGALPSSCRSSPARPPCSAVSHDEHAEFSHYFDMAWISVPWSCSPCAAAAVPAARRLGLVAMLGMAVVGGARFRSPRDDVVAGGRGWGSAPRRPVAGLARRDGSGRNRRTTYPPPREPPPTPLTLAGRAGAWRGARRRPARRRDILRPPPSVGPALGDQLPSTSRSGSPIR